MVFCCWILLLQTADVYAFRGTLTTVKPHFSSRTGSTGKDCTQLSAYRSNAYLNSLEQQTIEAATKTEEETGGNLSNTQQLMKQVKDAGTASIASYALWELGFWLFSIPVVLFGYVQFTGHLPDFSHKDDVSKLGAGKREKVCQCAVRLLSAEKKIPT